jgi:ABC-2 type transport system ATP-binding protein
MIQVRNLWKKFGRFEALQGLSFSVAEGSPFGLIGANCAGKTTTIKVAMNILEPSLSAPLSRLWIQPVLPTIQ